jgi:hypothetical protein
MSFQFDKPSPNPSLLIKKRASLDVKAPARRFIRCAELPFKNKDVLAVTQPASRRVDAVTVHPQEKKAFLQNKELSFWQKTQRVYRKFQIWYRLSYRTLERLIPRMTPNKLVYGSIMSGVAFGMVSMSLIEKTFETEVSAETATQKVIQVPLETNNYEPQKDVFFQYFSDAADAEYQAGVRELVKGYPIEDMLPYIFEKDRITAAFLIGIAKKESNWGKRVPVLEGQDCFNYWGYRGQRRLMGTGGHTCFNSRKDAVDTVAKRLDTLIESERLNTPAKLIVWKCGMSCEGHSRESVQKWIADVDAYYGEMMALEEGKPKE